MFFVQLNQHVYLTVQVQDQVKTGFTLRKQSSH